MANEHKDVSSATAGGAPAPDAVGTVRAVNGMSFVLCDNPDYGRRWVPVQGGGQYEDGEFWRVDTRPVVGAVPGTPAARDPRDAEIERLRGEVYSNNVAMGGFVTRIATALGGKSFGDARELVDDVQRLVRDCADNAEERKRAVAEVTRLTRCYDAVTARADSVEAERDEARAELERIAAFVGGSAAMPGSVRSAVEAEIGRRDAKHQRAWEQATTPLVGERDRLRRERDEARGERDRLATTLTNAEADRDIAQANERDLRRRLKRIAQETSFESALPDTDGEVPF